MTSFDEYAILLKRSIKADEKEEYDRKASQRETSYAARCLVDCCQKVALEAWARNTVVFIGTAPLWQMSVIVK